MATSRPSSSLSSINLDSKLEISERKFDEKSLESITLIEAPATASLEQAIVTLGNLLSIDALSINYEKEFEAVLAEINKTYNTNLYSNISEDNVELFSETKSLPSSSESLSSQKRSSLSDVSLGNIDATLVRIDSTPGMIELIKFPASVTTLHQEFIKILEDRKKIKKLIQDHEKLETIVADHKIVAERFMYIIELLQITVLTFAQEWLKKITISESTLKAFNKLWEGILIVELDSSNSASPTIKLDPSAFLKKIEENTLFTKIPTLLNTLSTDMHLHNKEYDKLLINKLTDLQTILSKDIPLDGIIQIINPESLIDNNHALVDRYINNEEISQEEKALENLKQQIMKDIQSSKLKEQMKLQELDAIMQKASLIETQFSREAASFKINALTKVAEIIIDQISDAIFKADNIVASLTTSASVSSAMQNIDEMLLMLPIKMNELNKILTLINVDNSNDSFVLSAENSQREIDVAIERLTLLQNETLPNQLKLKKKIEKQSEFSESYKKLKESVNKPFKNIQKTLLEIKPEKEWNEVKLDISSINKQIQSLDVATQEITKNQGNLKQVETPLYSLKNSINLEQKDSPLISKIDNLLAAMANEEKSLAVKLNDISDRKKSLQFIAAIVTSSDHAEAEYKTALSHFNHMMHDTSELKNANEIYSKQDAALARHEKDLKEFKTPELAISSSDALIKLQEAKLQGCSEIRNKIKNLHDISTLMNQVAENKATFEVAMSDLKNAIEDKAPASDTIKACVSNAEQAYKNYLASRHILVTTTATIQNFPDISVFLNSHTPDSPQVYFDSALQTAKRVKLDEISRDLSTEVDKFNEDIQSNYQHCKELAQQLVKGCDILFIEDLSLNINIVMEEKELSDVVKNGYLYCMSTKDMFYRESKDEKSNPVYKTNPTTLHAFMRDILKREKLPHVKLFHDQFKNIVAPHIAHTPTFKLNVALADIQFNSNSAYVITNKNIFYINKAKAEYIEVKREKQAREQIYLELKPVETARKLLPMELEKIASITKHTPTKSINDAADEKSIISMGDEVFKLSKKATELLTFFTTELQTKYEEKSDHLIHIRTTTSNLLAPVKQLLSDQKEDPSLHDKCREIIELSKKIGGSRIEQRIDKQRNSVEHTIQMVDNAKVTVKFKLKLIKTAIETSINAWWKKQANDVAPVHQRLFGSSPTMRVFSVENHAYIEAAPYPKRIIAIYKLLENIDQPNTDPTKVFNAIMEQVNENLAKHSEELLTHSTEDISKTNPLELFYLGVKALEQRLLMELVNHNSRPEVGNVLNNLLNLGVDYHKKFVHDHKKASVIAHSRP